MITQIGGVTGRRRRSGESEEIDEKKKYLPSLYAAKTARDYQDAAYAQKQSEIDANTALTIKGLDQAEQQASDANRIAIGKLGMDLGMGVNSAHAAALEDAGPGAGGLASSTAAKDALTGTGTDYVKNAGADATGTGTGSGYSFFGYDLGDLGGGSISDSLTNLSNYGNMMIGGGAGSELGAALIPGGGDDDDTWKRILGGAVGSGLVSAASGGSLADIGLSATGGGGVGAALSSFF